MTTSNPSENRDKISLILNVTNIHLLTHFLKSMLPIITNLKSKKYVLLRNCYGKKC